MGDVPEANVMQNVIWSVNMRVVFWMTKPARKTGRRNASSGCQLCFSGLVRTFVNLNIFESGFVISGYSFNKGGITMALRKGVELDLDCFTKSK